MSQIKQIPRKDLNTFIDIVANAYPIMNIVTEQDKKKVKERIIKVSQDPRIKHYGLYRRGNMLGGMRTYDFTMNFLSTKTVIGGVGLVAVDLLHKKEQVCKELILYFLKMYRKKGVSLASLYPFRPDFYKKMGFGFGTKVSQYRIRPVDLPRGKSKEHVDFLKKADLKAIKNCYHRFFGKTHGMIERKGREFAVLFDSPVNKIIGYKQNKKIYGYVVFNFRKVKEENWLSTEIMIKEMIYENRDVLLALLTFLHTQLDQVNRIVFSVQDDNFHFLPIDPRNGSENIITHGCHETNVQGVGIMYRVINNQGIFRVLKNHNFGGQNCQLKLIIKDNFLKENENEVVVHFINGIPHLKANDDYEMTVCLDISDFSSLIMGCVNYRSLYEYGLSEISEIKYVDKINKIFATVEKPKCMTIF